MAARVEDDPAEEGLAEGVPEFAQTAIIVVAHPRSGLDLHPDDGSVGALQDQVDLVAVVGSPVSRMDGLIEMADLFQDLGDREGLREVAEFGDGARGVAGQVRVVQTKHVGRDTRVDQVDLRLRDGTRP